MVSTILVLSALFSLVLAKPHARSMKVHELIEQVPSGFVKTGAADANTDINLRIALVQNNPNGLIDALYAVSTPDSSTYGEHLSKEEVCTTHVIINQSCRTNESHLQVEKFVAPSQQSVDAVNAWLKEVAVAATTISPAGDWLSVSIPVSQANELLDADFSVYKHTDTGKEAIRTLSYSIPSELVGHLDFVHPTIT